jgi:hypothetical protein
MIVAVSAFASALLPARATEFFVSPTASTNGTGSAGNPWTLSTALGATNIVQPGDTIWLRDGTYIPDSPLWSDFTSRLCGSTSSPIIVRSYPGEWAVLKEHPLYAGTDVQTVLNVEGSNTWFWGFEITAFSTTRVATAAGCCPTRAELPLPSSARVVGAGTKLIDLVIHDTRGGLGLWKQAVDCEVHGCLIYNNGFLDSSHGGHGHGAYCQNSNGVMRLSNNIIFNQFANGIQGYTVGSQVRNLHVEQNAVFGNAAIANYPVANTGEQLVFGGGDRIENLKILNNSIYQSPSLNGVSIRTDVGWNTNSDVTFAGNYIAAGSAPGGNFLVTSTHYDSVIFTNNTLWSTNGGLLQIAFPSPSNTVVDGNTYIGAGGLDLSAMDATNHWTDYSFGGWKTATGYDTSSSYQSNTTPPNATIVYRNSYDPKRAHIVVYNWGNSNSVTVDLSSVLNIGDSFEVRNAHNFLSPAVLAGTYNGAPIPLPLTNLTVAGPVGWTDTNAVPNTGQKFRVFVLVGISTQSQITAVMPLGTSFQMRFAGTTVGTNYAVQASTNLASWTTLTNMAPAGAGIYEFTDPDAILYPRRFYRLRTSY